MAWQSRRKGFASHRRIKILLLLSTNPELSLSEICSRLKMSRTAGAEHVRKLVITGHVMKRHQGRYVLHKVTDRGNQTIAFLRALK